jgi:hypothetical protein
MQYGIYPPPVSVMKQIFELGYHDANVWLSNAAYTISPARLASFRSCPETHHSLQLPQSNASLSRTTSMADPLRLTGAKLRSGIELIPPPPQRFRDFLIPQLARSIWEFALLFFSIFILFPFLFFVTSIERICLSIYANALYISTTILHYLTFCRSRVLQDLVEQQHESAKENLQKVLEPRLWLGSIYPLSHYIGTRHLRHDEFANMSAVYRFLQNSFLLKKYHQSDEGTHQTEQIKT